MVFILDLIPLFAFFYFFKTYDVFAGVTALLISTLLVYAIHLIRQKGKLNKQQWVTLLLTVVFCGLSLIFHDKVFIQVKSTIINAVFAVALLVSIFMGKPLAQIAFKDVFSLSQQGWNKLTLAWVGYFILMAGLQWYFAFHTSDATWRSFKLWGWIPVMLVFLVGQFVFLKNHINPEMNKQLDKK